MSTAVVPSDSSVEAPLTLDEPAPRALGVGDQLGLWANLGVSLLGFTGAIYVLTPVDRPMSLVAAGTALIVGTILGTLGVAACAVPGARTGAPSMVLLRGLFGARASYLPTVLNVVQLLGWTTFELVTIGTALHQVTPSVPRWLYVLAAGVVTTGLALRPLGWIRTLRRYVTVLVAIVLVYLFVQLLRNPLPSLGRGGWRDFWLAVDTVIGAAVSYVPVAADYSRHARSPRSAFVSTFVGYSVTQVACYALGLIMLVTVAHSDPDRIFGAIIAVPLGAVAFVLVAVREIDQSFVDTYSTAISVQNLRPRWDRRLLALGIGMIATIAALALNIYDYENFLLLLGSVFVPLLGVFVVDWYLVRRGRWDLSATARLRWATLVPWAVGFVAYQLVNPGYVSWWAAVWTHAQDALSFTPPHWLSASIVSFVVAAGVAWPLGLATRQSEDARAADQDRAQASTSR